jgi:hypothetical protein
MAEFDGNGVRYLYANNGNFVTDFNDRGARNDFSNPPINMEATGFFQGSNDDIAPKIRGGRHSDSASCDGCCYIPGFRGSGGVHYRVECPHPSYHDCSGQDVGGGPGSFGSMRGAKVVVWNTSNNCVHIELWQSADGNAPGNWTKVFQDEDCSGKCGMGCGGGPLLRPRSDSNQFTWRNDGNPSKKWLTLVEIQPGVSGPTGGTPVPGGGGVPPSNDPNGGMGDGGGGGGNDDNTGSGGGASAFAGKGCAIATAGGNTVQAGTCGGTGEDLLPGVGTGEGSGATEPKPLVTVFKDVGLLYNIRVDLEDNCSVQGDPNVTDFQEIYNVSPIEGEYISLFQNSTTSFYGVKLHSSQSVLYKKKIRKVAVTLKRDNPDAVVLGPEDGLKMEIRDIMGNVVYEFEDTYDPATIELADTQYEFEALDNTHKLEAGDMILLSYTSGGDTGNHIKVAHSPGQDSIDGFNTVYVESASGISYDVDQLADAAFVIYT